MFTKILCIAVIAVTIAQASPVGEEGVQSNPAQASPVGQEGIQTRQAPKAVGNVGALPIGFLSAATDGFANVFRTATGTLGSGVGTAQKIIGEGQSALEAAISSVGSG